MEIDNKLFWGHDAIPMALDYIGGNSYFSSEEFMKLGMITPGAERKR